MARQRLLGPRKMRVIPPRDTNRRVPASRMVGIFFDDAVDSSGNANVASDYDGATRAWHDAALTGVSDSKTGTVSLWINAHDFAAQKIVFANDTNKVLLTLETNGDLMLRCYNSSAVKICQLRLETELTLNTWHHVVMSYDLNGGDVGLLRCYVDGVSNLNAATRTAVDDNVQMTSRWAVGAGTAITAAQHFDGCLSQFLFSTEYNDLDNTAILERFYDGGAVAYGADGSRALGGAVPAIFAPDGNPYVNTGQGEDFDDAGNPPYCNPPNPTWEKVIWAGDSLTSQTFSAGVSSVQGRGYPAHALAVDGWRTKLLQAATAGDKAQDLIDNLPGIKALQPDAVSVNIGQNDFGSLTAAQIKDKLDIIWNDLRAAGIAIINNTLYCRHTTLWPVDDSRRDDVLTVNDHIRAQREQYADHYNSFNSDKNTLIDPDYTYDGLHPSHRGAEVMGGLLTPILTGNLATSLARPLSTTDTDADTADNICPNPLFTGSNAIATGPFTGFIADHVLMDTTSAPTSVVCSVPANPDAGNYQQFVATFSAAGEQFRMRPTAAKYNGTMLSNAVAGRQYWVECKLNITGPASTEVPYIVLLIKMRGGATNNLAYVLFNDDFMPNDPQGEMVLASGLNTFPSGTDPGDYFWYDLSVTAKAAGTWTIQIGQLSIKHGGGLVGDVTP